MLPLRFLYSTDFAHAPVGFKFLTLIFFVSVVKQQQCAFLSKAWLPTECMAIRPRLSSTATPRRCCRLALMKACSRRPKFGPMLRPSFPVLTRGPMVVGEDSLVRCAWLDCKGCCNVGQIFQSRFLLHWPH